MIIVLLLPLSALLEGELYCQSIKPEREDKEIVV